MRKIHYRVGLSVVAGILLANSVQAMPPQPEGDPQYWSNYCQGLLALRTGRYADAVTSFSAAIAIKPDPRVYLARAVANTCRSEFPSAVSDLSHANMPNNREPTLWAYTIWAMADIPPRDAERNGPGGSVWFSGMPGHMVQGRDDYPTDYASAVAYELGMAYNRARLANENLQSPELRAATLKVGQWFANRALSTREMAAFNVRFARQFLDKKQFREASEAINLAKPVFPFDVDIRFISAELLREFGRPESARREYTIAMTMATDYAPAYRGRALAAAAQGDARRAIDDLAAAARYDAAAPSDAPQRVAELLRQNPVSTPPASLLAKLDETARSGGSVEQLLPIALELQKGAATTRLRYDEIYQERLRKLEDASRAAPTNPEAMVAFASYILDELENRGEAVEPRRSTQFYRYQYSQEMEVSRAMFALDRALTINPKLPSALIRQAFAYDALGQSQKAENSIKQAMATIGTTNPEAIRLLAQYRSEQAGNLMARAQRLRTPTYTSSTHTENRSDGVYEVTVTTQHAPTSADLQNASACDLQARRLIADAKSLMESAIKASPNTLEGLLLQSSYAQWFGTQEQALAALREAAQKYPQSLKAHDALIQYYRLHGQADQAIEQRMVAAKLFQTTAGPVLERIWRDIHINGWPALMADVRRARDADPSDARTTAYLALAQAGDRPDAQAAATLRVALTLELARLKLDERGSGEQLPRPAEDFALAMRLLSLSGIQADKAGRADDALRDYRAAAAFTTRFAPGGTSQLMFGAMLPDPAAEQLPVPAPLNGASLAAEANVAAGAVLQSQNKPQEAMPYFLSAAALGQPRDPNIPQVGNGRGETNYSDKATGPAVAHAFIEVAKIHLSRGNATAASAALTAAGSARPTREQFKELNDLQLEIAHNMNSRLEQPPEPQPMQEDPRYQPQPRQLPPRQPVPRQPLPSRGRGR